MASILPSGFASPAVEAWLDDYQYLLYDARFQIASAAVLVPAITIFVWFFVAYQTSPLKKYPGPFLAGQSPHVTTAVLLDAVDVDRMDEPVAPSTGLLSEACPSNEEASRKVWTCRAHRTQPSRPRFT